MESGSSSDGDEIGATLSVRHPINVLSIRIRIIWCPKCGKGLRPLEMGNAAGLKPYECVQCLDCKFHEHYPSRSKP